MYVVGCNFCGLPSAVAIDQFDTFTTTDTNATYLFYDNTEFQNLTVNGAYVLTFRLRREATFNLLRAWIELCRCDLLIYFRGNLDKKLRKKEQLTGCALHSRAHIFAEIS